MVAIIIINNNTRVCLSDKSGPSTATHKSKNTNGLKITVKSKYNKQFFLKTLAFTLFPIKQKLKTKHSTSPYKTYYKLKKEFFSTLELLYAHNPFVQT